MVNNGISFESCYAKNPVCMPSRCSFLTRTYPAQNGVTHKQNSHISGALLTCSSWSSPVLK
ncbi:hypothetical protein [Oceanispirochaeta sp.]|uniref:hypothetical protein n=1 Tax=Oceanispirochaeta sp. TaxID=2035350 RepID=UPI00345DC3AB